LHVLCNVAFGIVARYARGDPLAYFRVGATNYTVAMVLAFAAARLAGGPRVEWPSTLFALYQGVQYQLTYIVIFVLFAVGGLAVTFTILRLSVVIPIVGSILIWSESPPATRLIGLIITVAALPLLGTDVRRAARRLDIRRPSLLMILPMAMSGSGALAAKAFAETRRAMVVTEYSFFVFLAAATLSLLTWPFVRRLAARGGLAQSMGSNPTLRSWRNSLLVGGLLGVANVIQNLALIQALVSLPGSVVFPIVSSGYLMLITFADFVLWKRRFGRLTLAGVGMALVGLVLINV